MAIESNNIIGEAGDRPKQKPRLGGIFQAKGETMKNKYWYAVMTDRDDTDWGTGSFDRAEAERMVIDNLDVYPDGYLAMIDGDFCVMEITPDCFETID